MTRFVELDFRDDVAEVWLKRPEKLNALSRALLDELDSVFAELSGSAARAVILAGRGEKAFCAGADIGEFRPVASTVEARERHYSQDICKRIESLPMPTIAAVHGYTFGGGMALAMACDMRLAAENTLFSLPETALGTFPGMGVTWRLPRIVGRSEAMRLIFTGERIDAGEAERIGFVNGVVPAAGLMETARAWAGAIAANAPLGVAYAREAIERGLRMPLAEGIMIEKDLNMFMDTTEDYREGARAFGERRKPRFQGK